MIKEISLKTYDLSNPKDVVTMAGVVKDHIVEQKLYTPIQGKNYVQVEGWQFAGFLSGLSARIEDVENISKENVVRWQAHAVIYRGEVKVGEGYAICSSLESKRKSSDEYVILSMAQTRAIGKAYRNLIGWVMKLAGYEATPSEEIGREDAWPVDRAVYTAAMARLRSAKSVGALQAAWKGLTARERKDDEVQAVKDEMKKKLA